MLRRGRVRAPVTFLIAACLGVFAAAQTPATASPQAASTHTRTAATASVDPAAKAVKDTAKAARAAEQAKAKIDGLAHHYKPTGCNAPSPAKNRARCLSLLATTSNQQARVNGSTPPATALTPADIQSAYHLPSGGEDQTVAIVDAFGYAAAETDLAKFRDQFGLPACSTDNGCFRKVDQRGGTHYPQDDKDWSLETALDLDAVSSACPACHILLVQADSNISDDLGAAVDTAVGLGAKFVSNSYGVEDEAVSSEVIKESDYDHPGVVITASSGDAGNVVLWPSSSPRVVSAGGTLLTRAADTSRGWSETAWSDGGSGCSSFEPRPDFQNAVDTNCKQRATADISADADPNSGLAVYNSLNAGWQQVGGTSLASPLVASMYALAGTPAAGTYPVTYPYAHRSSGLFDITEGTDGECGNQLCEARPGWDGPTGLGSPDGVSALKPGTLATVTGKVTNQGDGTPVANATVTLKDSGGQLSYRITTDSAGTYHGAVAAGTYTAMASYFGYGSESDSVTVAAGQSATENFGLTKVAGHTVSGKVTDGSGHGWPLYARIAIEGDPNGPVYSDPKTGAYSVDLPGQADYSVRVTPVYPGYKPVSLTLPVGTTDVRRDLSATADQSQCTAPGYGYPAHADFDDWSTGPKYGWTVTNGSGSTLGWQFDNPGGDINISGDGGFATAHSSANNGASEDTYLTSPSFSLAGEKDSDLRFGTFFYLSDGSSFDASVSTDKGATWTPVYQRGGGDVDVAQVDVPLTQALGHSDVQVRFHYKGQGASFVQMDNVSVGLCRTLAGGLVEGTVRDANTGRPVNGASVSVGSAHVTDLYGTAVSTATPDDPDVSDGFYWLYSSTAGNDTVSATAPRYPTVHSAVTASGEVVAHDVALPAGRLKVSPGKVSLLTSLSKKAGARITLKNTGGVPLKVTLAEQSAPASAAAAKSAGDEASWQQLPDYPEPVLKNVVGSYQGKTYSVGGMDHLLGGMGYKDGYVYDPAAGSWSPIADMPETKVNATGAFVNGTLYVAGGSTISRPGAGGVLTPTAYAYHPDSDTWSRIADLPVPLDGAASAVLDGSLYVIGGFGPKSSLSSPAYRYDPLHNTWHRIADYPIAMGDGGCGGIADGIVCAGGRTNFGGAEVTTARAYRYHPGTDTWTRAADMPYDVFSAVYSSANGELQVTGGMTDAELLGITRRAVQYDPVVDLWTDLPDAPYATQGSGNGSTCQPAQIGGSTVSALSQINLAGRRKSAILPGYGGCTGEDVNWLSENRTTVSLAPGQSKRITVTADTRVLTAPGAYAAQLSMITDTPYVDAPVPVTVKATAPASWAKVSGTVTDAAKGTPLAGATVSLSQHGERPVTVTTDRHGAYDVWFRAGTRTITVTDEGYGTRSRSVTVRPGGAKTADFILTAD